MTLFPSCSVTLEPLEGTIDHLKEQFRRHLTQLCSKYFKGIGMDGLMSV
jgi:hypothetical protein